MTSNEKLQQTLSPTSFLEKLITNGSIALTNREETTLLPFFQIKPTLKYTNVKVIHS